MTDHVKDQLCQRIEELEKEKLELNEQLDIAQQEHGALAAHLERMQHALKSITVFGWSVQAEEALVEVFADSPQASLSRLKAQWQAEALEEVAFEWRRDEMNQDDTDCVEHLERKARHKRQQAEGGEA